MAAIDVAESVLKRGINFLANKPEFNHLNQRTIHYEDMQVICDNEKTYYIYHGYFFNQFYMTRTVRRKKLYKGLENILLANMMSERLQVFDACFFFFNCETK